MLGICAVVHWEVNVRAMGARARRTLAPTASGPVSAADREKFGFPLLGDHSHRGLQNGKSLLAKARTTYAAAAEKLLADIPSFERRRRGLQDNIVLQSAALMK